MSEAASSIELPKRRLGLPVMVLLSLYVQPVNIYTPGFGTTVVVHQKSKLMDRHLPMSRHSMWHLFFKCHNFLVAGMKQSEETPWS